MKFKDLRDRLTTQRRIASALERLATAQEAIALAITEEHNRKYPSRKPKPNLELGVLDIQESERLWNERQEATKYGE